MCVLVGTGLQAIGSEIRVIVCQVGLWCKTPHSVLTYYLARIVFLTEKKKPFLPISIATAESWGILGNV